MCDMRIEVTELPDGAIQYEFMPESLDDFMSLICEEPEGHG